MHKILIANRGEIAVRVIRACRDLGLGSVAVFSECDRTARHVRMADEAVAIGGNPPSDSYLRIDRIIDAARATGADAVHPGYGFLSENENFASACRDAKLTFIGPTPEAVARVGSKTTARKIAASAGVPVVPGTEEPFGSDASDADIARAAQRIGYPVLIKAVAGGGGKGMRVVTGATDLHGAVRLARSEAGSAFGDSSVYIERCVQRPRHVEIQILADHHGTVVPFVERECSIQRRHQKLIEESPSVIMTPQLREQMGEKVVQAIKSVGYWNVGTLEFLVDENKKFYFMEMNTRVQVEHPVTERITGIDIVRDQILIAAGARLPYQQKDIEFRGHVMECRINAEDPVTCRPSPGKIKTWHPPCGFGVRVDTAAYAEYVIPPYYDSLIAKLIVYGADRAEAINRMRRALDMFIVEGVSTSIPLHQKILAHPDFQSGDIYTAFLDHIDEPRKNRGIA